MKKFILLPVLSVFVFLVPFVASAQVRINEIAWMGTTESSSNEWIELYNTGSTTVDLSGWSLVAADGSPDIPLASTSSIPAGGFFLLERTDDTSVPGVSADIIYTGGLENSGETLELKNGSGKIETVDASSGWPAGNNDMEDTMSWSNGKWITAMPTPGKKNSTADLSSDGGSQKDGGGGDATSTDSGQGDEQSDENISTHSGSVSLTNKEFEEDIFVDAGRDRSGVIGAPLTFKGVAFDGGENEVNNAHFSWNFGDGGTQDGQTVKYTYHFPGDYNVVLHAEKDDAKAVDRIVAHIHPEEVSLTRIRSGKDGFVEVENKGKYEVNLGGYTLEGENTNFMFPKDTIISSGASVRFANAITGLDGPRIGDVKIVFPDEEHVTAEYSVVKQKQKKTNVLKQSLFTAERKLQKLQEKVPQKENQMESLEVPQNGSQGVSEQNKPSPAMSEALTSGNKPSSPKNEKKDLSKHSVASAADSVVVVAKPQGLWGKVFHFFSRLGL